MTRLERKNRSDIKYMEEGGFFDMFDNAVKQTWRVDDEEYNLLCAMPNQILDFLTENKMTYAKAKKALYFTNKILDLNKQTFDAITDGEDSETKMGELFYTNKELKIYRIIEEELLKQ